MRRSLLIVDRFAEEAAPLRAHFEERLADPRSTRGDRFVWDYWHVPGQYTALRTPAWLFFPKKLYEAFHQRLAWWGRRVLGCHDISPPWLSNYVDGCRQELHGDLPHGQWAFVFSLTPWTKRRFTGGERERFREGAHRHRIQHRRFGGFSRDRLRGSRSRDGSRRGATKRQAWT